MSMDRAPDGPLTAFRVLVDFVKTVTNRIALIVSRMV